MAQEFLKKVNDREFSTLADLLNFTRECSDKGLFFRGENKKYESTACLPSFLRRTGSSNPFRENLWFANKLKAFGIGTPFIPYSEGDDESTIIKKTLLNLPSSCYRSWGEDRLKALIKHYDMDFKPLDGLLKKIDSELFEASYESEYLDITSDIMVALHFACSEYCLYKEDEMPSETETPGDGYLFLFDSDEIKNTEHLQLIFHPSYAYFYEKEDKIFFQPFDRITHQRGAFLAPKFKTQKNGEKILERAILEKEIKDSYTKIVIKKNVKQELFEIFGGNCGLNYYFPKIKLSSPKNDDIQKAYEELKGITLLEKNR